MQVVSNEASARKGKRLPEVEAVTNKGKMKKRPKKAKLSILALIFEDSTLEESFKHPESVQEQDRLAGIAQDLANGRISLEDLKSANKMAVAGKQAGSFDEKSFNERMEQPKIFRCAGGAGTQHPIQDCSPRTSWQDRG